MALNYKQVSIPMIKGVDTKTDNKLSDSPIEVVNAFVERDGVLRKKFGDTELSKSVRLSPSVTPYDISTGVNIASYLNDLIISTKESFYTYLESSDEWKENGALRLCDVSDNKIFNSARIVGGVDEIIENNDTKMTFYSESERYAIVTEPIDTDRVVTIMKAYVLDLETSHVVDKFGDSSEAYLYAAVPITNGTDLVLLVKDGYLGNRKIAINPVVDGEFQGLTTLALTHPTSDGEKCFSYLAVDDGFYITYDRPDGFYALEKYSYSGVLMGSATLNLFPVSVDEGAASIALNPNGSIEVVTFGWDYTTLHYYNYSLDLTTLNYTSITDLTLFFGAGVLRLPCIEIGCNSEGLHVFISNNDLNYEYTFISLLSLNGSSVFNFNYRIERDSDVNMNMLLQSKTVTVGDDVFFHVALTSTDIPPYITRNIVMNQELEVLAIVSELNSTYNRKYSVLPELQLMEYGFNVPYVDNGELSFMKVEIDKASSSPIQFQESLLYAGGSIFLFDGQSVFAAPFIHEPVVKAENDGAGSFSGSNLFKAVYKFEDASGNIYRSGTSNESEVSSSSNSVKITVSPLIVSSRATINKQIFKGGTYSVELYVAPVDTGLYRFISEIPIGAGTGNFAGNVLSKTLNGTASLDNNPFLYTTGNIVAELENSTPPALSDIVWHNGRVIGISAKYNELRYSKQYVRGEGLAFADEFFIPIEDNQGRRSERATALASLDSRLIIFKPNSILVISGDGPDNAGQNSDFTEPELITTDVGCNNPKSIVLTGEGIFFQSKKGIYLLDRSLSVTYIGAGIEQFKDDVINSALLMEERELLKFTTNEGRVLLYNHFYKQWTWYDDHLGAVSAANWKGDYVYIDNTGSVFLEDQSTHKKNGLFTERTYDTGWLKLTGIQNYQRVRKLLISGEYKDDHQLKVTLSYDYDDSTEEDYILSPQSGEDYQYSIHLRRQKSQSIRIKIRDVDTGSTDEGFKITDLTIEAGLKKGLNKFTSNRSY